MTALSRFCIRCGEPMIVEDSGERRCIEKCPQSAPSRRRIEAWIRVMGLRVKYEGGELRIEVPEDDAARAAEALRLLADTFAPATPAGGDPEPRGKR